MKSVVKSVLLLILFTAGVWSDLVTKRYAMDHLKNGPQLTVAEGFLELAYTENRGMVFGIMGDRHFNWKNAALIAVTSVSILFICGLVWFLRTLSLGHLLPFSLILSGAVANLHDRIRYGSVVDFIHIHLKDFLDWPYLFNVADVWICVGVGLLIILYLIKRDDYERLIPVK